ncbi:MAG: MFS transporter, partial [Pseudomonadota bacterium]
LAFLLIGAGLHMAQTAGLALATDIAPENVRPRVVALLYVMLLVGMGISAVIFGFLLRDFSQLKLIQIIQGAAVATFGLNLIALWKQEVQNRALTAPDRARKSFGEAWQQLIKTKDMPRLLTVIALGSVGFSMQDILLEPYGGEILSLSVSSTTMLTGLFSLGALIGFAIAAKRLSQGAQPFRLGGFGTLAGILAFSFVIMADPLHSTLLFQVGALLIGLSGGIFSVATLTAMMAYAQDHDAGIVIGAFGAVQATAAGGAIALGGFLRDGISYLANTGMLGPAFDRDIAGYTFVYHLEILILFVCLVAIGPLARQVSPTQPSTDKFGLPAFPG